MYTMLSDKCQEKIIMSTWFTQERELEQRRDRLEEMRRYGERPSTLFIDRTRQFTAHTADVQRREFERRMRTTS